MEAEAHCDTQCSEDLQRIAGTAVDAHSSANGPSHPTQFKTTPSAQSLSKVLVYQKNKSRLFRQTFLILNGWQEIISRFVQSSSVN